MPLGIFRCLAVVQLPLAGEELESVPKRRPEHREAVPAATRGAGQVDDQRPLAHARDASREQSVRCPRDRVGANRLRDPGRDALERAHRRLGRDVPRPESGAAGGQDEPGLVGELGDRVGDRVLVVGNGAADDLETLGLEQLLEQIAAPVLAPARGDPVRDGENGGLQS